MIKYLLENSFAHCNLVWERLTNDRLFSDNTSSFVAGLADSNDAGSHVLADSKCEKYLQCLMV